MAGEPIAAPAGQGALAPLPAGAAGLAASETPVVAVPAVAPAAALPIAFAVGASADPIVAAAAAASLTPFDFPSDAETSAKSLIQLGSNPASPLGHQPISASTAAGIAAATPIPAKPGHGGGGQDPQQPPGGPPGNAGAGGAGSGFGGPVSGGYCAELFGADLLAPPELRPHQCRLVLAAQAGATSLLHRPG